MNSKRRLVTPLEGVFDSANTKRKKKANSSMKAETYVDKSKNGLCVENRRLLSEATMLFCALFSVEHLWDQRQADWLMVLIAGLS